MDFVTKHFDFLPDDRCIVIGEIGVNHNNDEKTLFSLIDEGITADLDIIKFQRFNSSLEISRFAKLADYQVRSGFNNNQLEMAKKLELSDQLLIKAFEYCKERGVGFLCTAFEHESVDFLIDVLGLKTAKVASSEITNKQLIEYMAKKFDSLIISTGASNLAEVEKMIEWVKDAGRDGIRIALMHCTSQYPAPIDQVNLKAMNTMRDKFNYPIGYSDHTEGITIAIAAASLGAAMIEKHYTLDKNMAGPDHQASVNILELRELVKSVRNASASLGNGNKIATASELEIRPKIRKSLYCHAKKIDSGTVINENMIENHIIGIKRPYNEKACQPKDFDNLIGKKLRIIKRYDEPLLKDDFE